MSLGFRVSSWLRVFFANGCDERGSGAGFRENNTPSVCVCNGVDELMTSSVLLVPVFQLRKQNFRRTRDYSYYIIHTKHTILSWHYILAVTTCLWAIAQSLLAFDVVLRQFDMKFNKCWQTFFFFMSTGENGGPRLHHCFAVGRGSQSNTISSCAVLD